MSEENAGTGTDGGEGGGTGGDGANWYDGASPENIEFAQANGFADLDAVFTSTRHAQSLVGLDKGQVLKAPVGDDIASDDFQAYFNAGGRPESADGYGDLPEIEGVGGLSEDQVGAFNKMAYDAGLSTAQRTAMYEGYAGMVLENGAAEDVQLKQFQSEGLDKLRKEYGMQFEPAMQAGKAFMGKYFGSEFVDALDDTDLGNDPRLIGGFMKLAKEYSEPGAGAGTGRESGEMTPGEAKAELAKFEQQYEKAIHIADDANHDWAIKRRLELIKLADPDGQ